MPGGILPTGPAHQRRCADSDLRICRPQPAPPRRGADRRTRTHPAPPPPPPRPAPPPPARPRGGPRVRRSVGAPRPRAGPCAPAAGGPHGRALCRSSRVCETRRLLKSRVGTILRPPFPCLRLPLHADWLHSFAEPVVRCPDGGRDRPSVSPTVQGAG